MSLINKNKRLVVIIAILIVISAVFDFDNSLIASKPDSLSYNIEEPAVELNTTDDQSVNLCKGSFTKNKKVIDVKSNDLSAVGSMTPQPANQNEENVQDTYARNSVLTSALSIIYKLMQYFL